MEIEDVQTQKSFIYLKEIETVAQDILTFKDMKLELANAQNKFREALRAVEQTDDRNIWMREGDIYILRPREESLGILKNEIAKAEEDLSGIRNTIKDKMSELRDLEHEPRIEGFSLKPLSMAEVKTLHKAFGSE